MTRMLSALVVVTSLAAVAQPEVTQARDEFRQDSGPNLLTINPADLFIGMASAEYERALSSRFGLTVGVTVRAFRPIYDTAPTPTFTGINPEVGLKWHFFDNAPGGLWAGLTVNGGAVLARSDGPVTRAWSWGLSANVGHTFFVQRHLAFEFGVGGGFVDYGERVVWFPRLLLAVGSAF